ncbi:RNase adapter RapZ [Mediannikoviicoccus vaginalis]|uniref:RNase adapter RapZ n=1 Tax=Mediannikoviicoccus vaginalis TaxID=2899727 RepID=UPI001F01584F|nr:RNase adapter RapZ [Mediannikoviicoccus vaginalis]
MKVVIVTGMSGAGKTAALNALEDMGYYAVDNLPPDLIKDFIKLLSNNKSNITKTAIVVDIRSGVLFSKLYEEVLLLKNAGEDISILFLDARDEILVRRFKQLRRPHPLGNTGNILSEIAEERDRLKQLKDNATHIIDTSTLTLGELKSRILSFYGSEILKNENINITIMSFGFKNGTLLDADLVFDVRFIPNPYYVDELKEKTGEDEDVREFVFKYDRTNIFLDKVKDLVNYLLPFYKEEGKSNLVIGIGCTGGRHRSVAIANELGRQFEEKGETVYVSHRDSRYW